MEFIDQFKKYLETQKTPATPATVKNYIADVRAYVRWVEEYTKRPFTPQDLTTQNIAIYRQQKKIDENGNGISSKSINRHVSSLRKFSQFLVETKLLKISPFQPQTEEKTIDPWHVKEFRDYLYVYGVSDLTIKNYITDIVSFQKWCEEVLGVNDEYEVSKKNPLKKLNPLIIQEYKDRLINVAHLAPASVNRKLSSIRKYLEFAVAQEYIRDEDLSVPNLQEEKEAQNLTLDDLKKQFAVTERKYSSFPPLRLMQKIITPYFAFEEKAAEKLSQFGLVRSIFGSNVGFGKKGMSPQAIISNIPKEMYDPYGISTKNLPLLKKIIFFVKYTRPNWYKKYKNTTAFRFVRFALVIFILLVLGGGFYSRISSPASQVAQIKNSSSPVFSFTGRLTNEDGSPIASETSLRFSIYNSASASGSALLWQEEQKIKPDTNGVFSTFLGTKTGIPTHILLGNTPLFLGITVGNTPELFPRQKFGAVAYALDSEAVGGMTPITSVNSKTANSVLALDSTGHLTIGGNASTTFQATGGEFKISGNTLLLTTNLSSNSNVVITPDGSGTIDLQKNLVNTTDNGDVIPGAVAVNDAFVVNANEANTPAAIINNNGCGSGNIFEASASGTTQFVISCSGNVGIGVTNPASALSVLGDITATGNINATNATLSGILTVNGTGTSTVAGPLNLTSNTLLAPGDLTINPSGGDLILSGSTTINIGGSGSDVAYNAIGSSLSGANTSYMQSSNDLYVQGNLQVGNTIYGNLTGNINPGFTDGAVVYAGAGGMLAQNPSNFFWDLTNLRLGIGTNSPSSTLTVAGTITTSGNILMTGSSPNIQANSTSTTLTIGGSTTGNIVLTPNNGTGTVTITGYGTGVIHSDSSGVLSSSAVNLAGGSSEITGTLGIANGGTGATSVGSAGAIAYSNGSVYSFTAVGSGTQCLIGGVTPSWGSCDTGVSSDVYWSQTNGILYANNSTVDFSIGGQSTASAKFAVLNINSGTPTATLSAGSTGGSYLTATGTLQTTANQTLTLGGNTTGNVTISPLNGSGTITLSNLTTAGGVLYTNSSGVISQVSGTASQCLVGGTTPTFTSCGSGTDPFWNQGSGLLYPNNSTVDFSIGGQSTASAKFAVININSGIPTATLSAGNAGGSYLTADGTLQTTNNQALTIGGNSTGNITLSPLNGSGKVNSTGTLNLSSGKTYQINNTDVLSSTTLGSGVTTSSLTTVGSLISGSIVSGFGTITTANTITGTVINGTTGINTGGGAGTQRIDSSGNLTNIGTTQFNTITYTWPGADGSGGYVLSTNGAGILSWINAATAGVNYWSQTNGALYPQNSTLDFFIGGQATQSAKFAVLNINTGTPVASVSATGTTDRPGISIGGDGTIQSINNGTLTIGGNSTGNIALSPLNGSGQVNVNGTFNATTAINTGAGNGTQRITSAGNLVNIGTTQFNSITYTWPGSQSSGYVLQTNGSGTLAWVDPSTAVSGSIFWNQTNGLLYPKNSTVDVTIGGQSTTSAKFAFINVNSGTPTASISAGTSGATYLNASGTLQTTANQTLTLGGDTTGNITLSPLNGSGKVTSTGTVTLASGKTYQINATDVLSSSTLGSGVTTSSLTTVGALVSGSIASGFGTIETTNTITGTVLNGTTAINTGAGAGTNRIDSSGNLVNIGTTQFNSITYTWPGSQSANYVLQTNGSGTLSWVDPAGAVASSIFWNQSAGVLFPKNSTVDLTVGGQSTQSAKFAVLNINTGTPVASVSATGTTDRPGISIGGDGVIQSVNNGALTIGGATTGNITLSPLNGSGKVTSTGTLTLASGKTYQINGTDVLSSTTLGSGVTTSSLTTVGALVSGSIASGFGTIATTNTITGTTINGTTAINTGAGAGTNRIDVSGNLVNIGTTQFNSITYTWPGSQSANYVLQTNGSGTLSWVDPSSAVAGSIYWNQSNGLLYPKNSTVDVTIGGQSTTSAKFAFINVNNGTPTASISAGTAGATYLTADGKLATTAKQTLALGDSTTTGNIVLNGGNVGVNTTTPTNTFDAYNTNGTSLGQISARSTSGVGAKFAGINFRIDSSNIWQVGSDNSLSGAAQNGLTFRTSSGAEKVIIQTDGNVGIGTTAPTSFKLQTAGSIGPNADDTYDLGSASKRWRDIYLGPTSLHLVSLDSETTTAKDWSLGIQEADGGIEGNFMVREAANELLTLTPAGQLGIGNPNPIGKLNVQGESTGTALVVFNYTGSGQNILVASNSGTTVTALDSGGNLAIEGAISDLSGTTLSVNDNLSVSGDATITGGDITGANSAAIDIGEATSGDVEITGDLLPSVDNNYDFGSTVKSWRNIFLTGSLCFDDTDCATSINSFGYWDQSSGALYPKNSTVDFLVGGQSTASAKFAVLNINNGTPTASISAGTAGATYLNASGTLQTTANQTLTFGGDTTGNITLSPLNGSGKVTSTGTLTLASGKTYQINGTDVLSSTTLGTGVTTSSLATVGTIATGVWQGTVVGATYGGTGINSSGLTGIPYITSGAWAASSGLGTSSQCLLGGATPAFGSCGSGTDAFWNQSAGVLFPNNSTVDFAVGGQATASATFAVLNNNIGTPTATVAGNLIVMGSTTAGNGGNVGIGTTSTLAPLHVKNISNAQAGAIIDTTTTNDIFTASASGTSRFVIKNDGNVGIGSTIPLQALDVNGDIKVTGNDINDSGNTSRITLGSTTTLTNTTLTLSGTTTLTASSLATITSAATVSWGGATSLIFTSDNATISGSDVADGDLTLNGTTSTTKAASNVNIQTTGGNVGIGTTAPTGRLEVQGNPGGATLIVNNTGSGAVQDDIFAASAGGALKFVIKNGGNVGIGTISPSALLSVGATSQFQVNSSGAIAAATGITSSGTITFSGFTGANNGGVIYANSSGVLSQTAAGSSSQCLLGGTTPVFGSCGSGTDAFWNQSAGVLFPNNSTVDFTIGGQATASAKFAVLNVNSGTPTTTASGNMILMSYTNGATQLGGNLGIGTTSPHALTHIYNDSTVVAANETLRLTGRYTSTGNGALLRFTNQNANGTNPSTGEYNLGGIVGYDFDSNWGGALAFQTPGTGTSGGGNLVTRMTIDPVGNVGIGTTAPVATLHVRDTVNAQAGAIVDVTTSNDLFTASASGAPKFVIRNDGNVGIGTVVPSEVLSVNGNINAASGSVYKIAGTSVLSATTLGSGVTTSSLATVGTIATGVWQGTRVAAGFGGTGIDTSGSTGIPFISSGTWSATSGLGSSSQCLLGGATPAFGSCPSGTTDTFWQQTAGMLLPNNATVDFAIGGTATASAKFAILNVNNGTPTATIAGNLIVMGSTTAGNGGNVGIGTTSTLAPLHVKNISNAQAGILVDTTTSNDVFTASVSGTTKFVIKNGGNVGIGTNVPGAPLEVFSTSSQLKLTYDATHLTTFATDSSGNFSLTPTGGNTLTLASGYTTLTASGLATITTAAGLSLGGATSLTFTADNEIVYGSDAASGDLTLRGTSSGTKTTSYVLLQDDGGNVGIGTTAPIGILEVRGGTGGQAALKVNQLGATAVDDIFTASAAGTPRFVIRNDGNVGIGTVVPSEALSVNGNINIASGSVLKIAGTSVLSATTLGTGVTTSSLATVGTIATGVWQGTRVAAGFGGTGIDTSATTGLPYISSGTWTATSGFGTTSQCLIGGTTPSFTTCPSGTTDAFWQQTAGMLIPNNATVDLAVGGTSTASARFAFLNVNRGTPTFRIASTPGSAYTDFSTNELGILNIAPTGNEATVSGRLDVRGTASSNAVGTVAVGAGVNVTGTSTTFGSTLKVGDIITVLGVSRVVSSIVSDTQLQVSSAFGFGSDQSGKSYVYQKPTFQAFTATGSATLSVDALGNVGIATTAALLGYPLDVNGSIVANSLYDRDNTSYYIDPAASGNAAAILGNVGIGTTSPNQKLDVFSTSTQLRLSYDTTHYNTFATDSSGNLALASTGGNTITLASGYTTLTASGLATITTAAGLNLDATTSLTLNSGTIYGGDAANEDLTLNGTSHATIATSYVNLQTTGGNVGIGTTAPVATLHVRGTVNTQAGAIVDVTTSNDVFTASVSGATKFVIRNGGNVGIGTTNPSALLFLNNTITTTFSAASDIGNAARFQTIQNQSTTDNTMSTLSLMSNASSGVSVADIKLIGTGANTSSLVFTLRNGSSTWTDALYLKGSGDVGIGTTSPLAKLHVTGNPGGAALIVNNAGAGTLFDDIFVASAAGVPKFVIKNDGNVGIGVNAVASPSSTLDVSNTIGGSTALGQITVRTTSATSAKYAGINFRIDSSNLWQVGADNALSGTAQNGLTFRTAFAAEKMIIQTDGNVGIGSTTPGKKLDVNGTFRTNSTVTLTGLGTTGGDRQICGVSATGVISIENSTTCGVSSQRFKENINNLAYGLDEIMQLRPVSFQYKESFDPQDRRMKIGFIAEEMYNVIPEVVNFDNDGLIYSMNYDYLTSLLAKGIQEQQVEIQNLQSTTADLQAATGNVTLDPQGSISLNYINNAYMAEVNNSIVNHKAGFSEVVAANLQAGLGQIQDLTANSVNVATDSLTVGGKTLAQYIIDVVEASGLNIGNGQSINSPLASIDEVHTNIISPLGDNLDIKLNTNASSPSASRLAIKDVNNNEVASIDSAGNATFSGSLASNSLNTNDASVSGTLRASHIIANSIDGLEARVATLAANYITANSTQTIPPPSFTDGYINISSFSAQFAMIDQGLISLGPTTLNDTSVLGTLNVGTTLSLSNNSINVFGSNLEIQPLRQGGVSFMGGLITFDTDGNMEVAGNANFAQNVKVNGKLFANIISPLADELNIDLSASDSARFNIRNASGSAVLAINNKGDLNSSGSGTFGKFNISFAEPALALSDTTSLATGSAGVAQVKSTKTEVTIQNKLVTDKSLIYITPVGTPSAQTPFLLRQNAGTSFSVGVEGNALRDIPFNWLIIN